MASSKKRKQDQDPPIEAVMEPTPIVATLVLNDAEDNSKHYFTLMEDGEVVVHGDPIRLSPLQANLLIATLSVGRPMVSLESHAHTIH